MDKKVCEFSNLPTVCVQNVSDREEIASCVRKNNKTGGSDGLVGELLKYCGSGMVGLLKQLLRVIWREKFLPLQCLITCLHYKWLSVIADWTTGLTFDHSLRMRKRITPEIVHYLHTARSDHLSALSTSCPPNRLLCCSRGYKEEEEQSPAATHVSIYRKEGGK